MPAFPFISQDRQYGRCAHAVIWMIAHYHHLRHAAPQRFMSNIVAAAAEEEFERIIPSKGLTDDQVGSAFRRLGLGALRYGIGRGGLTRQQVEDTVRRYMNSRMPLALAVPEHLTAVIGAGYDNDGRLTVIQCDDEHGAYVREPIRLAPAADRWEMLFVPLPGRIFVPYEEIDGLVIEEINRLIFEYEVDEQLTGRNLRYREYVVEVREYKRRLAERNLPGQAAHAHALAPSARWLWVLEVQDRDLARTTPECVIGEIAVDATSDAEDLIFLCANFPGIRASWPRDEDGPRVVREPTADAEPYLTGTALNV